MDIRLTYTDHLVRLAAEAAAAAARLASANTAAVGDLAARAAIERARVSLRLDASPLEDATADEVDAGRWRRPSEAVATGSATAGGWAAALKLEGLATQDVAAVEYANLVAAHAAEERLAATIFEQPLAVLAELHGIICEGLVDPELAGRPRRTAQAIHDGAQGLVIFNAPDPDVVPGLLAGLATWLRGGPTGGGHPGSAGLPAVAVAGIVHERLLEWQPFEAANGRLARSAAAMVLRARGLDPHAIAVPERAFAEQPGRYYSEVAASRHRRGDLTLWVEWSTEAIVAGLQRAVSDLGLRVAVDVGPRAEALASGLGPGDAITVAEHADAAGISRETAFADLWALAAAGLVRGDPGTRGLRYRRVEHTGGMG